MATVKTFAGPQDWNLFSYVMEKHQRCARGSMLIMSYLQQMFLYPTKFETALYASQLLQGEAIRYGVEHFRRIRGVCMGAVYWQLKRLLARGQLGLHRLHRPLEGPALLRQAVLRPVLLSCCEEGLLSQDPFVNARPYEVEKSIRLNVANETRQERQLTVCWSLRDASSRVIGEEHRQQVTVPALSALWLEKVELPQADLFAHHVYYSCCEGERLLSEGTVLFSMPKFYQYQDPRLTVRAEGDELVVSAAAYAASVEVQNENQDLLLSDNYFDMEAGEKRVKILSGSPEGLRIRSVYDIR